MFHVKVIFIVYSALCKLEFETLKSASVLFVSKDKTLSEPMQVNNKTCW